MAMLEFLAFASWHYVANIKGGTNPSTKASEEAQISQCSKLQSVLCPESSFTQSKAKGRKKTSATDLSLAVTKFMNKMIPFVFNANRDDIKKAHDMVEMRAKEEALYISSNILKIAKETKALDSKANEVDFLSTKYFIFEETLMQKATTALVKLVEVDVAETEKIAAFAEEMSKVVTDFLLKMFDKSKDRILINTMVEAIETARDGILFEYLALRFFDIVVSIKMQLGIIDSCISKKKNKKKC